MYLIILPLLLPSSYSSSPLLIAQFIRQSEGFLLVYSITSRDSFEEVEGLVKQISKVRKEDVEER